MSKYTAFYDAVDEIRNYLSRDLIGPISVEEVIEDQEPLSYYAMGILWPQKTNLFSRANINGGEDITLEDEESLEDPLEAQDDSINSANNYKPSSLAVSAMLAADTARLRFTFECAKYAQSSEETETRRKHFYTRKPISFASMFTVPQRCSAVRCIDQKQCFSMGFDIILHVRRLLPDGKKLITISVANIAQVPQKSQYQNENALFQCKMRIMSDSSFQPVYQNKSFRGDDLEDKESAMLYRNVFNYAYGHGCSVRVEQKDEGVFTIESEFMPIEQVLQMMPGTLSDNELLQLSFWRKVNRQEGIKRLEVFINEYREWRRYQFEEAMKLGSFREAADLTIDNIDTCIHRLKSGVDYLGSDDIAWQAFLLMNEAMLLQRIKTKRVKEEEVAWYPFQLAYILQIIPDISGDKNTFRDTVDLLWFPTGGGKTEAYMGVAAFAIFYRRLKSRPDKDGVTVLMRYTLRLLTLQQFERATALICACEHLRKKHNIPGGEISIGMWIGSNMTPNHLNEAESVLRELRADPDKKIFEGNPVQVSRCPWCGMHLDVGCYNIGNVMTIRCANNKECEFHQSLPIYLVDDDIYNVRPTLLLSTIDKFARIVWEEKSKALFGAGGMSPELIIQDELHLISGPLGSIAGIYEIAVSRLCNTNGRAPKVIASTATIKNAKQQIKNLYNSDMLQFPPSGISFEDSFFAVIANKEQRPARTYIGLCETGGSLADLMIRVHANMMFIKQLFSKQGKPEDIVDQYYTAVGYFNAIKDLGASASIINDRAHTFIHTLIRHKFKAESEKAGLKPEDVTYYVNHDELTSRKTAKEIKETLQRLDVKYTSPACYSYILASNMLSVGIDIDRLGVMSVYNQPKTNAEYIQATSRVGRRYPGVVLALYNTMRSRDKSHYEQFGFYHKAFYQYVEATSLTPFSARAIEKALHCVFIAMVRLCIPGMGANADAARFRKEKEGVSEIKKFVLARIRDIKPSSEQYAKDYLEAVAEEWDHLARTNPDTLVYKSYNGGMSLLNEAEKETPLPFPPILNSLRNVEASSNVFIQARER